MNKNSSRDTWRSETILEKVYKVLMDKMCNMCSASAIHLFFDLTIILLHEGLASRKVYKFSNTDYVKTHSRDPTR